MKSLTKFLFFLIVLSGASRVFATSDDRHLSGFNGVNVAGSYDVYITQGNSESVKVDAPSNMQERIITEVQGGVLKIYTKHDNNWNNWNNDSKITIYVTAKTLNDVSLAGSGNVYFKEGISGNTMKVNLTGSGDITGKLNVKTLNSNLTGSGNINLAGKADDSNVRVVGSGDYTARDLATVNTAVHLAGSGNATVNVSQKIEASVSGSGDINYTGKAQQVVTSKAGSGSINRI